MAPREEDPPFKRHDAIGAATRGTLILGGAGFVVSSIQNTLTKQNVGVFGVVTRTGGTIVTAGMSPSPPHFVQEGGGR